MYAFLANLISKMFGRTASKNMQKNDPELAPQIKNIQERPLTNPKDTGGVLLEIVEVQ